jgi:hypothetical protein
MYPGSSFLDGLADVNAAQRVSSDFKSITTLPAYKEA